MGKEIYTGSSEDLNKGLIGLTSKEEDILTISDFVRGCQIFGGIGSGKTSGSGKTIAKAFLKKGFGGLVLCGKPDEAEEWQKYAAQLGRKDDLLIFREESEFEFNPLQYEMTREGDGAGETMNLVNLFVNIFKMGQRLSGGESQESERFWENSLRRCMNRIFDLLKLAGEEISVANMVEVLETAPEGEGLINRISEMKPEELSEWIENSYCMRCLDQANNNAETSREKRDFNLVFNYFLRELARAYLKTQG